MLHEASYYPLFARALHPTPSPSLTLAPFLSLIPPPYQLPHRSTCMLHRVECLCFAPDYGPRVVRLHRLTVQRRTENAAAGYANSTQTRRAFPLNPTSSGNLWMVGEPHIAEPLRPTRVVLWALGGAQWAVLLVVVERVARLRKERRRLPTRRPAGSFGRCPRIN